MVIGLMVVIINNEDLESSISASLLIIRIKVLAV